MTQGYEALRSGAGLLDLAARGRIRVTGRDRVRLLHNLTSNDIKRLTPGQGCYAFLLNPQGRIQADLCLFAFDDRLLIDTEPELRDKVRFHIRKYVIADQVELADISEELACLAVEGPGAAALLSSAGASLPKGDYSHTGWGDTTLAAVSVTGQPGFRIYTAAAGGPEMARRLCALGAVPATPEDVRLVRIENGKPRYGDDIGENSLPQETQQMHAVSFQKGCYLGQEIVERIRARGHVNRKLVRLEIPSGAPPAPGTTLTAEGKEAGQITSVATSTALAYVRTPHDVAGTVLRAGDTSAVVR